MRTVRNAFLVVLALGVYAFAIKITRVEKQEVWEAGCENPVALPWVVSPLEGKREVDFYYHVDPVRADNRIQRGDRITLCWVTVVEGIQSAYKVDRQHKEWGFWFRKFNNILWNELRIRTNWSDVSARLSPIWQPGFFIKQKSLPEGKT